MNKLLMKRGKDFKDIVITHLVYTFVIRSKIKSVQINLQMYIAFLVLILYIISSNNTGLPVTSEKTYLWNYTPEKMVKLPVFA